MASSRFAGKTAIVTGGGAGIGRAICLGLAREGAAVMIADRDAPATERVAAEIAGSGGRGLAWAMDLGDAHSLGPTVAAAKTTFGSVDILVNCAATSGSLKPVLEATAEDWDAVLRVNLLGTVLLTQAAVRQMLAQGKGGAIVNILAIQAEMPLPKHAAYAASKAALGSFTRSLAIELADKGIRANGIAVSSITTDNVRNTLHGTDDAGLARLDETAATLIGRMGRPEDIARIALFLASEDSAFMAGAIIPGDGGRMISRKNDPFLT